MKVASALKGLIAYCVKKGILYFSYVLEDGLLGTHFGYDSKKVKIENASYKSLPVQKGGFQETASPKARQDRSWLNPC